MAILKIARMGHPVLRSPAQPVKDPTATEIRRLVQDMAETMYEAPGIGLAATQVDVHEQLIVIDTSEARDQLRVLINPEIIWASEERQVYEEGCLSVPGIYDGVERPSRVRVRALDVEGNPYEFDADGLLAVCVQHEIDHLNGILFVDKMGRIRKEFFKNCLY